LGVKTPENKIEQECREEFQLSDFVQQKEKDTCSHQTVPWTLNRLKNAFSLGLDHWGVYSAPLYLDFRGRVGKEVQEEVKERNGMG